MVVEYNINKCLNIVDHIIPKIAHDQKLLDKLMNKILNSEVYIKGSRSAELFKKCIDYGANVNTINPRFMINLCLNTSLESAHYKRLILKSGYDTNKMVKVLIQ